MGSARTGLRARTRDDVRRRALAALHERGPQSRTDLADLLGLPKTTTALVVGELLAAGAIVEQPGRPRGAGSGSGRPAGVLVATGPTTPVVGIDIGHRHVRVALTDRDARIVGETSAELDVDREATRALDRTAELLDGLLARAELDAADVRAATAGIPGPIDSTTGMVQSPTILAGWVGLDLPAELRSRTGLDVHIDNDANLGALGELTAGAGREHRDFIYVKASNGIGAGLVLGGAVYRGAGGMAGEIGHTQLDPNGEWCRCGNRGCLEATVSVEVVRRQLEPLGIDPLAAQDVTHPVARKVLAESGRTVGRVVANLGNALNPTAVILGGDLSATGDAFLDGVRESIERLAQPGTGGTVEVVVASLGRRAELIGALTAAAAAAREAG